MTRATVNRVDSLVNVDRCYIPPGSLHSPEIIITRRSLRA